MFSTTPAFGHPFYIEGECLIPHFVHGQWLVDDLMPGQAVAADLLHEGIGVELLDVEDAFALPGAGEDHLGAEHGGHAGGVGNGLGADLLEAFGVVAVVIDIVGALLAVLDALDLAADGGLAVVAFSKRGGFGEHGFQELQRNYVHSLVIDGLDARHANFLQHVQNGKVFLSESHPEAGALDGRVAFHERLKLLMIKQIGFAVADVGVFHRTMD